MSVLRCDFFLHNSYHTIFFLISQALYPRPRGASEPCLCACQLRLGSPAPRSEQAPSGRGRRSLATPSSVADEDTEAALVTNITCVTHHVTVRLCLSGNHSGSFYARLFFFFFLPGISLSPCHLSVTFPSFETRSSSFPQESIAGLSYRWILFHILIH